MGKQDQKPTPGDGLRSLKSTMLFRAVNYELYVKPNKGIMLFGVITILGCAGYIFYMRHKYENMEYVDEKHELVTTNKKYRRWDE